MEAQKKPTLKKYVFKKDLKDKSEDDYHEKWVS